MAYTLRYHPRVADQDLDKVPAAMRKRIARSIEARLTTTPERFGVPLAGPLRGHWKLRVGDDRVVFKVTGGGIWILAILHRRDVYERVSSDPRERRGIRADPASLSKGPDPRE